MQESTLCKNEVELPSSRLDQELRGEPLTIGARTLVPVARLSGVLYEGGGETSRGIFGHLRLRPVEVTVRDGDSNEERIAIRDATRTAALGMAAAAAAVAILCSGLILLGRLLARRR
jgi:hypothetical protein